jgi:hypothetical protein
VPARSEGSCSITVTGSAPRGAATGTVLLLTLVGLTRRRSTMRARS